MSAPDSAPVHRATRIAGASGAALVAYALVMEIAAGWGLPHVVASSIDLALIAALLGSLGVGPAGALLDRSQTAGWRVATAAARGGLALLLAGLLLGPAARTERTLEVAEGDLGPHPALPGVPVRRFGAVQIAPHGDGLLLSKSITIDVELDDGSVRRVGLSPTS